MEAVTDSKIVLRNNMQEMAIFDYSGLLFLDERPLLDNLADLQFQLTWIQRPTNFTFTNSSIGSVMSFGDKELLFVGYVDDPNRSNQTAIGTENLHAHVVCKRMIHSKSFSGSAIFELLVANTENSDDNSKITIDIEISQKIHWMILVAIITSGSVVTLVITCIIVNWCFYFKYRGKREKAYRHIDFATSQYDSGH
jgi:hypothetical protein